MTDFVEANGNGTSVQMTDWAAKAASDHKEFKQAYKDLKKNQMNPKKVQIRTFAYLPKKLKKAG